MSINYNLWEPIKQVMINNASERVHGYAKRSTKDKYY